jgi:hypothetical protein
MAKMKDTMTPSKPEDYEPAIPQNLDLLKKELDHILNGGPNPEDEYITPYKYEIYPNPEPIPSSTNTTTQIKTVQCICPKTFSTKKRRKKLHLVAIHKQTNGYAVNCPVHGQQ